MIARFFSLKMLDYISFKRLPFYEGALVGVFIIWLLALCAPAQADPLKILVFGDSLSSGYQLPDEKGFPRVLEDLVIRSGFDAVVLNMSVPGETTSGALRRLQRAVELQPDIVIVELGLNDALRGDDPRKVVYYNIMKIVDELKRSNASVILCGVMSPMRIGDGATEKINEIFKFVAKHHQVVFYPDFLAGVAGRKALTLSDGIHPNAQGVETIVTHIYPQVDRLLRWRLEIKEQNAYQGKENR